MQRHRHTQRIEALLAREGKALGAYAILEAMREEGVRQPPTVYRALARLMADGRVHRVESLNAYVACARPGHEATAVLAICDACGGVEEIEAAHLVGLLARRAASRGFETRHPIIELHGQCGGCAAVPPPAGPGAAQPSST